MRESARTGSFGVLVDFIGKHRLIVEDQRDVILAGNVLCGDDREFIPRDAGSNVI